MTASPFYTPGVNPAITLYNYWLHLLLAQGAALDPKVMDRSTWHNQIQPFPVVSYGEFKMGVTVNGFDSQQRPILSYGSWYRRHDTAYPALDIDADGNFRLLDVHGDMHNRIERHTFLGYGWYGGQYIWYVSPQHGIGQSIDARDWRARVPYLRERVIKPYGWSIQGRRRWMYLDTDSRGYWSMHARPDNPDFQTVVQIDQARVERAYRRYERAERGFVPTVSVRDGKTRLDNEAAVLHIAALLDVSTPAKATPRPKTPREVTV